MLVLLRHPECVDNADDIMVGQRDSPLTTLGLQQAREAAETLSDHRFSHIYTSDLLRASDFTRTIVGRQKFPTTYTMIHQLRERSGGYTEGKKYAVLKKELPPRKYKLWQRDYFEAPPGGESLDDVADRVIPWFKEYVIPRISRNEDILVVAHSGVIRVIFGYLKQIEEPEIMKLPIEHAMPYFFYGRGH